MSPLFWPILNNEKNEKGAGYTSDFMCDLHGSRNAILLCGFFVRGSFQSADKKSHL
jgi:hypothetical protein